jgi:ornithine cyclodeaminase
VHVNSVGANPSGSGEVDAATIAEALVAVESRESTLAPPPAGAPEFMAGGHGDVVELGELVSGARPGRTSPEQITLYKSVGVAVQDAAAAALVLAAARKRSVGREIELGEST